MTDAAAAEPVAQELVESDSGRKSKPKLKLKIAHQVPGRIRMKISAAKGDPELLDEIKTVFAAIPGLSKVTANPTTGSVVLHYDPNLDREFNDRFHHHCKQCELDAARPTNEIDELARKIQTEAEFLAENSESARAVVDFFKKMDAEIKSASGNVVDLKVVLAAGVIAFTVLEVGATAATPVWVTFAVFGLNHAVGLQSSARRGHHHHGHAHAHTSGGG
jgi:hypothetical protein